MDTKETSTFTKVKTDFYGFSYKVRTSFILVEVPSLSEPRAALGLVGLRARLLGRRHLQARG